MEGSQDTVNKRISRTITWLRWPLIVGIMSPHVPQGPALPFIFSGRGDGWFLNAWNWADDVLGPTCLYVLFLISGYLFFIRHKNEDGGILTVWKGKIWRRIGSVVAPYIVWNALYILALWVPYRLCIHQFFNNRSDIVFSWGTLPQFFWNSDNLIDGVLAPVDYPLWYLRMLFMLCLLAPVIWVTVRRLGCVVPLIVCILAFGDIWPGWLRPYLRPMSVFYFVVGAWMAMCPRQWRWMLNKRVQYLAVGSFLAGCVAWFIVPPQWHCDNLMLALGVYTIGWIGWKALYAWHVPMPAVLTSGAFILYAFHVLALKPTMSFIYRLIGDDGPWHMMAVMIASWVVVVVVSLALSMALQRWCPWLHSLLSGGR